MFWYLTCPVAFESFIVPWYLTNSIVNKDSFWQRQNQQLTWATDLWKVQISYEIKGWCCCCGGRMGLPGLSNSIASIAPQYQVCISSCFLILPSPSPLQKQPVLPGVKSYYCKWCPDQRGFLERQGRTWWKFADAKVLFSDAMLHASVTSVITDLANFFSRQSSSKMANRLSFCIVYLLGSGE